MLDGRLFPTGITYLPVRPNWDNTWVPKYCPGMLTWLISAYIFNSNGGLSPMATREDAGMFALVTWRALAEDYKRHWPELDWKRLDLWLDDLGDSDPSWMFVNALIRLPALGKWFDACISQENWLGPNLPPEWFDYAMSNTPDGLMSVGRSLTYLPVVSELFPEWVGIERHFEQSLEEANVLVVHSGDFPLDPERVKAARQFLFMHNKFTVRWEEGSDVQVASEFWFCGCGSSAFAFNSGLRQRNSRSDWIFQGRIESSGLTNPEEDRERDGSPFTDTIKFVEGD